MVNRINRIALILAVFCGITSIIGWGMYVQTKAERDAAQDDLKVQAAQYATGACGTKYAVPIDEKRFAVAGLVVSPRELEDFVPREEDGVLKVYHRYPVTDSLGRTGYNEKMVMERSKKSR